MYERAYRSKAIELRELALGAASDKIRQDLLMLAERYERLSELTEERRFPYVRLPRSLFN
jgi:hypothetical protein